MPKFDDTIRQAVMRACEAMGGECALAAASGCSQTQISRYRSGGCGYIRPESWDKLYPHIAPYLPEDFQLDTEPPKRKNPNESIFKAVDAAARHHPRGGFGLATDAGFTPAQICRYRHGKVSWFSSKTLAKLLPHIAPYLQEKPLFKTDVKSECSEELIARAYLRGSIDTLLWYSRIKVCAEIAAELEGILTRVQTGQITAETAKAEIKAFFHNGGQSLADFLKQAEAARMALLNSNNHKEEHR